MKLYYGARRIPWAAKQQKSSISKDGHSHAQAAQFPLVIVLIDASVPRFMLVHFSGINIGPASGYSLQLLLHPMGSAELFFQGVLAFWRIITLGRSTNLRFLPIISPEQPRSPLR